MYLISVVGLQGLCTVQLDCRHLQQDFFTACSALINNHLSEGGLNGGGEVKDSYISSSCSDTTQGGHTPAEIQVLYGAAVIISCALTNQPKTLNRSPSLLLSALITVTFSHFEISTLSNLLLSFLLLHPLFFSYPFLL